MRRIAASLALVIGGTIAALLLLGVAEGALRALHIGTPRGDVFVGLGEVTPIFERATAEDGTAIYRTAPSRRLPSVETFLADKPLGGFRAFVVGGSSAAGTPYSARWAFSAWLDRALEAALPSVSIEVINAGVPGFASRRVLEVAREVSAYAPDLLIVYAGHNEYAERRYYEHLLAMDPRLFRLRAWVASTHLYGLLTTVTSGPPRRIDFDDLANGREMFAVAAERQESGAYASERELEYGALHYRFNLEEMARAMRAAGARVMFVTQGQDFADWAPGASAHRPGLSEADRKAWDEAVASGGSRAAAGDWTGALAAYGRALALDDGYAQLHFDVADCHRALGDAARAREHYVRASDLDQVPHGAPTRFNAIARAVATDGGHLLVDGYAALEAATPDGLVGRNLFVDLVHPSLRANQILARAIAGELRRAGIPRPAAEWLPIPPPPAPETLYAADPTLRLQEHLVRSAACALARRTSCAEEEARAALQIDPDHAWAKTLLRSASAAR